MSYLPITLTAIAVILLSAIIGFIIRWIWSGSSKPVDGLDPEEVRCEQEKSERRLTDLQTENQQLKEVLTRTQETVETQAAEQVKNTSMLEKSQSEYEALKARSDNIEKLEEQYQKDLEQSRKMLEITQERIQIIEQDNEKLRATLADIRQTSNQTNEDESSKQSSSELLDKLHAKMSIIGSPSLHREEDGIIYNGSAVVAQNSEVKIKESQRVESNEQLQNTSYEQVILPVETFTASKPQEKYVENTLVDSGIIEDDDLSPTPRRIEFPRAFQALSEDESLDKDKSDNGDINLVHAVSLENEIDNDILNLAQGKIIKPSSAAVDVQKPVNIANETVDRLIPTESILKQNERSSDFVADTVSAAPIEPVLPQSASSQKTVASGKHKKPKLLSAIDYLNDESFEASATNRPAILTEYSGLGPADDLKKIRGVEGRLERELNKIGLYYYNQIEQLSPFDIAWIDKRLKFNGRIAKDNWPVQASALRKSEKAS